MKEYDVHYETLSNPVECSIQYVAQYNNRFYMRVLYQEQLLYISMPANMMLAYCIDKEYTFTMNGVYLYHTLNDVEYKHRYTVHSEIEVVDIFI